MRFVWYLFLRMVFERLSDRTRDDLFSARAEVHEMVDVNRFLHGIENVPKKNKIAARERASRSFVIYRFQDCEGWEEPAESFWNCCSKGVSGLLPEEWRLPENKHFEIVGLCKTPQHPNIGLVIVQRGFSSCRCLRRSNAGIAAPQTSRDRSRQLKGV